MVYFNFYFGVSEIIIISLSGPQCPLVRASARVLPPFLSIYCPTPFLGLLPPCLPSFLPLFLPPTSPLPPPSLPPPLPPSVIPPPLTHSLSSLIPGVGKSTLLRSIAGRELRLPSHVTILHVEQEVVGDDTTALESVLESDEERTRLLRMERELVGDGREEGRYGVVRCAVCACTEYFW